jgi:hypothetical protein
MSPARYLLLAAACLGAFEAGCTADGGVIGMAPEGDSTAARRLNDGSIQSTDAAGAVVTGNFRPLIDRNGAGACMEISEDDVPTNYVETVLLGAVVGTVVLAAIGAAAGAVLTAPRGGDGAIYGAMAGAALGGWSGTENGLRTAEQKENFAVQIARYECQIQAAAMENASLKGAGDRLQASVAGLTSQLDQLEQDYANRRMTRAQAQKELNDIDDATASLQHRLSVMKDSTEKLAQDADSTEASAKGADFALDPARVASLEQEIAEMQARNAELDRAYGQLVERRKALVLQ